MAISYVNVFSGTTSATLSGIVAGDLLICVQYNQSNATIPTLPSGFTLIKSQVSSFSTFAAVVSYKIAAGGETGTGTLANTAQTVVLQHRGAAVGLSASATTSNLNAQYPSLGTLNNANSVVLGILQTIGGSASRTTGPTGWTKRFNNTTNGVYQSPAKSSFAGDGTQSLDGFNSTAQVTFSVEIKESVPPISATLTQTEAGDLLSSNSALAISAVLGVGTTGSGGTAWDPSALGTALKGWYDLNDPAAVVPNTWSPPRIDQLLDKSGNASHLTNDGFGPIYDTTGFSGSKTGMLFGQGGFIRGPWSGGGSDAWNIFTVHQLNTIGSSLRVVAFEDGNGGADYDDNPAMLVATELQVSGSNIGVDSYHGGTYAQSPTVPFVAGAPHISGITCDGAFQTGWYDGVGGTPVAWTPTNKTVTPVYVELGGRSNGAGNIDGYIAEVVIVAGALTTADRQKIEGYLAWKWGVQSLLPSGHPYKSAAPTSGTITPPQLQEANDTLSATGSISLNASLSAQMDQDTLAATAQLALSASFNRTEQNDTLFANSSLDIHATATAVLLDDVLSSTATLEIHASTLGNEENDTVAALATLVSMTFRNASLGVVEADDAISATSRTDIMASAEIIENDDTLTSVTFGGQSASLAGIEDPDTLAGIATLGIQAWADIIEQNDTAYGTYTIIDLYRYAALLLVEAGDVLSASIYKPFAGWAELAPGPQVWSTSGEGASPWAEVAAPNTLWSDDG